MRKQKLLCLLSQVFNESVELGNHQYHLEVILLLLGRSTDDVSMVCRFCLLETSCEQDDNFPPNICVRVNGKMAQLPVCTS